jgi:hypothetical protein
MRVDYHKGVQLIPRTDVVEYDASDRVKLSYHTDGFVQFSGENPGRIVSGRDPVTGEPKGLAVMTSPISKPVETGPTFAVAAWGLDDFAEEGEPGDGLVFEEDDFYYRGCDPDSANAYEIEAFLFPKRLWAGIRKRPRGGLSILLAHYHFEGSGAVLEWRVVPLPGQPSFLGFSAHRVRLLFAGPSGFTLAGPGERYADGTGTVLQAIYPLHREGDKAPAMSLDLRRPRE